MRNAAMTAAACLGTLMLSGCGKGGLMAEGEAGSEPLRADTIESGYVQVGQLAMYYEIHGRGEPLVLLHGGGSTIGTTFGRVLPKLATARRIVAVETQGHGHTADIDRPLSFEQDADDVAALLRELGIGQADVLGFSNGGNVALQLGIRHPEAVRRLVIASAFVANDGLLPQVRASFDQGSVANMPEALRDAYLEVAPEPNNLPNLVEKLMRRLIAFEDISETILRSLEAPTLVIIGDDDVVTPEHAIRMTRTLPRSQLAIFPNADHGSYLGEVTASRVCAYCPDVVVAMIDAFLKAPIPVGQ